DLHILADRQVARQIGRSLEANLLPGTIDIVSAGVDRLSALLVPQSPHRIESFERKAQTVDSHVTGHTRSWTGLQFHPLPRRQIGVQVGAERRERVIRWTDLAAEH